MPSSREWNDNRRMSYDARTAFHLHLFLKLNLLMNSFNKTEAAVFSCRLCFLRAFPYISLKAPGVDGNHLGITIFLDATAF